MFRPDCDELPLRECTWVEIGMRTAVVVLAIVVFAIGVFLFFWAVVEPMPYDCQVPC